MALSAECAAPTARCLLRDQGRDRLPTGGGHVVAVYASGDWHVKPGREREFVDAWRELVEWSTNEYGPHG